MSMQMVVRLAMMFGFLGSAAVGAEEVPDLEFLEYLGSWEESDEDWMLFSEADGEQARTVDERSDPAPAGKESTENEDDS